MKSETFIDKVVDWLIRNDPKDLCWDFQLSNHKQDELKFFRKGSKCSLKIYEIEDSLGRRGIDLLIYDERNILRWAYFFLNIEDLAYEIRKWLK